MSYFVKFTFRVREAYTSPLMGYINEGRSKIRGKVPSCSYFVNQLN